MKSLKLDIFREKLLEVFNDKYPNYKVGEYINGPSNIVSWLSVIDCPSYLRIAEVIIVDKFSPNDTPCDSLLIIDYVNSYSGRYDNVDNALTYMKSVLSDASKRKEANEGEWRPWKHVPISTDKITVNTIGDINKAYLVTGRCNGKTLFYQNVLKYVFGFKIKDVIFNDPATIVFWSDGEKTVVQCQNGEEFDPEKGLAMAISKKIYGNNHAYYDVFKKWVGKYRKKKFREALDKAMEITPDEITRNGHRYVLVKDGTEVTDNGIISNLKLDETDTVLNPQSEIKVTNQVPDGKSETKNPREGKNFNDYLAEQLKDPEFKKNYDEVVAEEENTEVLKPYCDKQIEKPEDNNESNN